MLLKNTNIGPSTLEQFVGQKSILERLKVMIQSAKMRNEPVDHILFSGPPGLGKTTLATLIASEMNTHFYAITAPHLTKAGDLVKILSHLEEKNILFIDEMHRLNRSIEEVLYTAMENFYVDILLGEGITAKTIRLNLKPFTLIGATTRTGYLSSPLRNRFGMEFSLSFYTLEEISQIILNYAKIFNLNISEEESRFLAQYCRMTPREAIRILKRIRDYAIVENQNQITRSFINQSLEKLGIYMYGIREMDKKILKLIAERYDGGPVGIKTISSLLDEEEKTLLDHIEPFLLKIGLIEKTKKGRVVTQKGYEVIKNTESF